MDAVIVVLPAHAWQEFNARCQDRPRLAAQFVAVAAGNSTTPGDEWLITKDHASPLRNTPEHLMVTLQRLRVVLNRLSAFAGYERALRARIAEFVGGMADMPDESPIAVLAPGFAASSQPVLRLGDLRRAVEAKNDPPATKGDPPRAVPDQDPDRP